MLSHPAPTARPGSQGGHVPDGLVYGPVVSRRFGRSLGLSFSLPGEVGCQWKCPYCQLGGGTNQVDHSLMAEPAHIVQGLSERLQMLKPGELDVITIAGAGEPLDHPQAVALLASCQSIAQHYGLPLVLLTNGDALTDPAVWQAVAKLDQAYIKWDPGAGCGSWRALSAQQQQDRFKAIQSLPNLRLQSLLFRLRSGGRGNTGIPAQDRYLQELEMLNPIAVQLTTADRDDPSGRVAAVDMADLGAWAELIRQRLGHCQVHIFCHQP